MIANSYLGEHRTFNGRLMNNMRGLRGLNYGDYSYIENFIQDGGGAVPRSKYSAPATVFQHLDSTRAARERPFRAPPGASGAAHDRRRGDLAGGLRDHSRLLAQLHEAPRPDHEPPSWLRHGSRFYGTDFFIDEIQDTLARLTTDDVNAAITRHLQYDNLAIAIVTSDAEEFRAKLLSNDPSPITYNTEVSDEILEEDQDISSFHLAINPDRIRIVPVEDMFR